MAETNQPRESSIPDKAVPLTAALFEDLIGGLQGQSGRGFVYNSGIRMESQRSGVKVPEGSFYIHVYETVHESAVKCQSASGAGDSSLEGLRQGVAQTTSEMTQRLQQISSSRGATLYTLPAFEVNGRHYNATVAIDPAGIPVAGMASLPTEEVKEACAQAPYTPPVDGPGQPQLRRY